MLWGMSLQLNTSMLDVGTITLPHTARMRNKRKSIYSGVIITSLLLIVFQVYRNHWINMETHKQSLREQLLKMMTMMMILICLDQTMKRCGY